MPSLGALMAICCRVVAIWFGLLGRLSLVLVASFLVGCVGAAPRPRVVDLAGRDGVPLKATYFAAGKSGPGVLLLHQCNRQRAMWDKLAPRLAAAGMNVLTL